MNVALFQRVQFMQTIPNLFVVNVIYDHLKIFSLIDFVVVVFHGKRVKSKRNCVILYGREKRVAERR